MIKNKKMIVAVFIFLFMFLVSTFSYADVGNINRYSNNSSSSSNDYSSSGSSSSRKNYTSSSSSSGGSLSTYVIIGIGFLVVLYFYGKSKGMIKSYKDIANISKMKEVYDDFKNSTSDSNNNFGGESSFDDISKNDPNFSEEKFMSWVNNVFIKLQTAWTNRDWKVIRPFESNELFEQHSAQLQEYINSNKINVVERISIVQSEIAGYEVEGDKEFLFVSLVANLKDYIIDATTKEVIEGDKNKDYQMFYKMTFYRKFGVKTKEGTSNMSTTNCPNCGAPTEITSAGQCKYCDSVITTGDHDWVLSKIEGEPC